MKEVLQSTWELSFTREEMEGKKTHSLLLRVDAYHTGTAKEFFFILENEKRETRAHSAYTRIAGVQIVLGEMEGSKMNSFLSVLSVLYKCVSK